ncbi:MAG: hypothetical protein MK135_12565 [Polyangiaceae bacterium]|nr:hypothetical protein [Polyangiaceae bacterium]
MTFARFLSTKTDQVCPRCDEELKLVDPIDAMAPRPFEANVFCPECHYNSTKTLLNAHYFHSVPPTSSSVARKRRPSVQNQEVTTTSPTEAPPPPERASTGPRHISTLPGFSAKRSSPSDGSYRISQPARTAKSDRLQAKSDRLQAKTRPSAGGSRQPSVSNIPAAPRVPSLDTSPEPSFGAPRRKDKKRR